MRLHQLCSSHPPSSTYSGTTTANTEHPGFDMLWQLADANGVAFSATYLRKDRYTGPYLQPHEGIKFRNHQVRRLLEWHFGRVGRSIRHCELVFDRHSHSLGQLDELRSYLSNNYRLPPFAAVTAVDSRYVEVIQVADLALRMFRRQRLQANPGWAGLDLSFICAADVSGTDEPAEE